MSRTANDCIYLGLGSNQGDRAQNIQSALRALDAQAGTRILEVSCLYESEPVDMPPTSTWFVNVVARIKTSLPPEALLQACLTIEHQLGRTRSRRNEPRPIDIDILFYGDACLETATLKLPHPRLHQRAFVLVPLLELAPGLIHPRLGKSIQDLHLALATPEEVILLG